MDQLWQMFLHIAGVLLQVDILSIVGCPSSFRLLSGGGLLIVVCSSHCFYHFPLACRNLRIDITILDFTPALSGGDHYSMANAVAEVELDNGRSAEIYIAADYEYENSLITRY